MAELIIIDKKNSLKLVGDLVFSNAMISEKQGAALLLCYFTESLTKIDIDLSEIQAVDSSLMTVLLSWIKLAKANGIELNFTGITSPINALIQLNDLGFMFNV